ncbi:MAG: PAS domain-containing protein [Clostridia bacterium]|nr:PAS domain-containing protein [Clostridia bacterium]
MLVRVHRSPGRLQYISSEEANTMDCAHQKNCLQCPEVFHLEEQFSHMDREKLEQLAFCAVNTAQNLNALIENSSDSICVTDGNGLIIKVNEAYEQLSKIPRSELVGRNVRDLIGDVTSASSVLLAIQEGKSITIEQKLLRQQRVCYSTSRPIFQNGKIVMVITNNRDFDEIDALRAEFAREKERSQKFIAEIQHIREQNMDSSGLVVRDRYALQSLRRAQKAAAIESGVLIMGETGVGKEEYAKFIHHTGNRKNGPFVCVNCGAIAQSIIESELFGYEKGAYTGANPGGKHGLFEVADHGTIFLDEIGELPPDMQVKLLRVLQEKEIMRVGGNKPIKIDVRVLAATNQDLRQMILEKSFREDLFYRLSVIVIEIPPLRERPNDIVPLAVRFLSEFNDKFNTKKKLSRSAFQLLKGYSWPGNIRELKNVLEEAVVMSESDRITPEDFPFSKEDILRTRPLESGTSLNELLEQVEYDYLKQALQVRGSIRKAGASLGLPSSTFARRIKSLGEKYGHTVPSGAAAPVCQNRNT